MDEEIIRLQLDVLQQKLHTLPRGSLTYKTIQGKKQPYLQWTESGKTKSKYIKIAEREQVFQQLALRQELLLKIRNLQEQLLPAYAVAEEHAVYSVFKTSVVYGDGLLSMAQSVSDWQKRDVYAKLKQYMEGKTADKVCVLYGLRRTGKTTMLRQCLLEMTAEQLAQAVYIKAKVTDSMADLNHDLQILRQQGYRYVFIDEVTLLKDFIDGAALFSDVFAAQGMKLVLSGTDSLGFWFAEKEELYDRAVTIHTTMIPFREHSRLLGLNDIDDYICYGGTLKAGSTDFEHPEALAEDASFRDDESTRRYIDTAICKNIQHSLACCEGGGYFRHLQELYEEGELTGAINRIIEDMNHRFVLRVLVEDFKSHDFGSAANVLRKERDSSKRTDILDRVDKELITSKLMQLLEIKNKKQQRVQLTQEHVFEIKEYLQALELVAACPVETMAPEGEPYSYTIFTQPGMRYCQAQALVYSLLQDKLFCSLSERQKQDICQRILQEVRGRMLEDIVLLETLQTGGKHRKVCKLKFAAGEYDMIIYNALEDSCELYEIKHSQTALPQQYRYLVDGEMLKQTEMRFGRISKRCVLYRGAGFTAADGIIYQNVEEYLRGLQK